MRSGDENVESSRSSNDALREQRDQQPSAIVEAVAVKEVKVEDLAAKLRAFLRREVLKFPGFSSARVEDLEFYLDRKDLSPNWDIELQDSYLVKWDEDMKSFAILKISASEEAAIQRGEAGYAVILNLTADGRIGQYIDNSSCTARSDGALVFRFDGIVHMEGFPSQILPESAVAEEMQSRGEAIVNLIIKCCELVNVAHVNERGARGR